MGWWPRPRVGARTGANAAAADGGDDAASGRVAARLALRRVALDLVITLDGATSPIYAAILVAGEGTASTFAGLAETIATHGLP